MEYSTNAKMMLGYIDDDDDEILDYDGNLDLSSEDEEGEEESVQEYAHHQYPETPEEKINWQEQIRMIHLRSHLNQLLEGVKHAQYVTDKTREELKKCREQIQGYEAERDALFREITTKESAGNKSAVHRVRATHERICEELREEQGLEANIMERLDQAEYDLAVAEVERGKFILAEDDLLQREHQLSKEKTDMAMVRLHKEEVMARQGLVQKRRDQKTHHDAVREAERRHYQAVEEAERSHERANKYLQKTLNKMTARQKEEEVRYKDDMGSKMDMLLKLRGDIAHNRENLKAIRARDKAAERREKSAEQIEKDTISSKGGNPEEVLLVKRRRNEVERKKIQFEAEQKVKKAAIMQKILQEEENLKKRRKQQPALWGEPEWERSLRVAPIPPRPLQTLETFVRESGEEEGAQGGSEVMDNRQAEMLEKLDQAEEERAETEGEGDGGMVAVEIPDDSDSGGEGEAEETTVDLAAPEFEGLWNRETKPYRVPKDTDTVGNKPLGGSKMEKGILEKVLERTREGIVVTQVAAGREFKGCPFYSKPDVIHFKDFVVGKTYKKKVTLTNVSYTVNYIRFCDITERLKDFVNIDFDPPGQLSAGLTCEMDVTFRPMINEDLTGEVSFLTQTGPFNIPLICSTKKCDLVLDTGVVDFGTTVIGETMKRSFTLTNRGALGTKFDFFKVTGAKARTCTTAVTSLGRMTTDSMRTISPEDSAMPGGDKALKDGGKDGDGKKKSEEALDKIPEVGETQSVPGEGGDGESEGGEAEEGSDEKEGETEEAISPDLAVSEMEDYGSLDGMKLGPLTTGEIGPNSSLRLEIIWQPTIPGKVDSEFLVNFADPLSEPLPIHALANAIDVPVWVDRSTVDLRICMFDRLYQDTIIVHNRASTALKLKFEVCRELRNHLELLPKTGYIQAKSSFSAQMKFLPRKSLFQEASKFFDKETGVLEAPMTIRVADQTTPVHFTVQAVLTSSDLQFDLGDIDFGHCTIHEAVRKTVRLTNHSILPQQFGFVGLPEYIEVQPNDGFGTLLPLETLELDVIFSPSKTRDYKLELVCRSLINRDFKISVRGVGVLTPLSLSAQVTHFPATPLYDVSTVALHVLNNHTSSNEFTHPVPRIGKGDICPVGPTSFEFLVPNDAPVTVSPKVGTVMPGEKCRIQVRFAPTLNDYDVRQEALRIHTKMEALREEREAAEAERREREEAEVQSKNPGAKKGKGKETPKASTAKNSKTSARESAGSTSVTGGEVDTPRFDADKLSRDAPEYLAAVTSLTRQFRGQFESLTIPCCVASGRTGNPGALEYSTHNTLYMSLHCPTIKPPVVVISDGGRRTVDFGDVSIGQTCPRSVTIQNISDQYMEMRVKPKRSAPETSFVPELLTSSTTNPHGPFVMLNCLRTLPPGHTHTIMLTFAPQAGVIFQEELCIKTHHNTLHLTLRGRGVSPALTLDVEGGVFDCQPVLVGEYVERLFKMNNTSTLGIDYVIKQDSLSPLRHQKQQEIPSYMTQAKELNTYVGSQNENGRNVFDIVPTTGRIEAGETKEVMVTFAPDHESDLYSDGIRIELFDQEESHFFRVVGQAKPRTMFLDGHDLLTPGLESLAGMLVATEEDDPEAKSGVVTSPPVLVTIDSVLSGDTFTPGVREIYAGCVRTMAVSQKKPGKTNGEFSLDGIQGLVQKGFTIEPQKGMVEAGVKKPIVFTWTPPPGFDPSITIEESCTLTLRCDVTEQIPVMVRGMVVSD